MSHRELTRLEILQRVEDRRLNQTQAATMLGMTPRQMRRLVRSYRAQGPEGLVSKKRGKIGNHRRPKAFRDHILAIIRDQYADFGPTLAREKLLERHSLLVPGETLRGWMRDAGIWLPRGARRKAIQQPRARRQYFGELIQIDGSEHHWFEDRGPYCSVLTYVDDATSRLQLLRFVEGESTFDYMQATKLYIERYGKPVAFYSDKHTVFHINKRSGVGGNGMTQYGRALHELGIEIMCANTPAAKGRVERAHGTLQDRLVKEMRLEGISTMDQANAWIDQFVESYNSRFSKPPSIPVNAHRPLLEFDKLTHIHQGEVVPHKRLGAMLELISHNQKQLPDEKRSLKCPTRRYPSPASLT